MGKYMCAGWHIGQTTRQITERRSLLWCHKMVSVWLEAIFACESHRWYQVYYGTNASMYIHIPEYIYQRYGHGSRPWRCTVLVVDA